MDATLFVFVIRRVVSAIFKKIHHRDLHCTYLDLFKKPHVTFHTGQVGLTSSLPIPDFDKVVRLSFISTSCQKDLLWVFPYREARRPFLSRRVQFFT